MKMKLPDGVSGFGAGGFELQATNGVVDVPPEFVQVAMDHGLTAVTDEASVKRPTKIKVGSVASFSFDDGTKFVGTVVQLKGNSATLEGPDVDGQMVEYKVDAGLLTAEA